MDITCGTDIIEIERVKKLVDDTKEEALYKIYTKAEIEYCESRHAMKYQHYAARFAAKEAVFKAISSKLNNKYDISWNDVEVLNDESGRPSVHFIKNSINNIKSIDVSLSHCREHAISVVTVIWG